MQRTRSPCGLWTHQSPPCKLHNQRDSDTSNTMDVPPMHVPVTSSLKPMPDLAGRGAWTPPKTLTHLATTSVAASDPRVGPPRTVVSLTRKIFHTCDTPVRGGQLSGHLQRRSWWLNRHTFSVMTKLQEKHEPPQVSHMARHAHAPAAHSGCYLQRIRTCCGVGDAYFDTPQLHMEADPPASKHLIW